MLSRHYLRAKVLQTIYSFKTAALVDESDAGKNFKYNVEHLNELSALQMGCLRQFIHVNQLIIETGLKKMMPTFEEKNPSYRLVNNAFLNRLFENYSYRQQVENTVFPWELHEESFNQAYLNLKHTKRYAEYMALTTVSFEDEKRMALDLFKFLMNEETVRDIFQERSLWWDDDFDQMAQYTYALLKDLNDDFDESTPIPQVFDREAMKDIDDYNFARQLLIDTIKTMDGNEQIIRRHLKGWEFERVGLIDLIIINMAITEFTQCPTIPERVTIDECVELAKEFCGDKSRIFINGILEKIMIELRMSGKINKSGRGLFIPQDEEENFNPTNEQ